MLLARDERRPGRQTRGDQASRAFPGNRPGHTLLAVASAVWLLGAAAAAEEGDAGWGSGACVVDASLRLLSPDPMTDYERHEIAGFSILMHRDLALREPSLQERVLVKLRSDLDVIAHRVPSAALSVLRKVEIWVELQGRDTSGRPAPLRGMCCHWSVDWLAANGVLVDKVGDVEILNPRDYLDWVDQPFMLLHELAHAYHWRLAALDAEIEAGFQAASASGAYDAVQRNSLPADRPVRAYAVTNSHEYFAELSEAYFGLNDFYPYSRGQLQAHDPAGYELMERVWNLSVDELAAIARDRDVVPPSPGASAASDR